MAQEGEIEPDLSATVFPAFIYIVALITGAIVMSFEMLRSRYLHPYFGSGIYTWAALISTVLGALTAGYFLGGISRRPHGVGNRPGNDRRPCIAVLIGIAELRRSNTALCFR